MNVKRTDVEKLETERAQRRRSYWRNRDPIIERQKMRYRKDPVFRQKMITRSRQYNAGVSDVLKKLRRAQEYAKDPIGNAIKAREWYDNNYARAIVTRTGYRKRNRLILRRMAAVNAAELTDSYVRNQLSKYSSKSTREWTAAEVGIKRMMILRSRIKRVTAEKAEEIRARYRYGNGKQLAREYGVSVSLICMIIKGDIHKTDTTENHRSAKSAAAGLRLLHESKVLARFLKDESSTKDKK